MVVVMGTDATSEQVDAVVTRVSNAGGDAFVSRGVSRTIIGLVGDVDQLHTLDLRGMPGVTDVVRISAPYKLVSRQHHPHMTTVYVGDARVPIGPDTFTLAAGPCAVETPEQTLEAAQYGTHCRGDVVTRRGVQAPNVAVRVPGPGRSRLPNSRGRSIGDRLACRHRSRRRS